MIPKRRTSYDTAEVALCYLEKYMPEVRQQIDEGLKAILPPIKFADYDLIPQFLQVYCEYRGVSPLAVTGTSLSSIHIKYRKEFTAVLLLCYHPEKLHELTYKRTQEGIQIAGSSFLSCNPKSLANFIPYAQYWFKTYADFKEPVEAVHAIILERFKDHTGKGSYKKGVAFTPQSTQLNMFG